MLMKVFNRGQVVIPADTRRALGIRKGDRLEMTTDHERRTILLRKPEQNESAVLAGSLSEYARGKPFPSRSQMREELKAGLRDG